MPRLIPLICAALIAALYPIRACSQDTFTLGVEDINYFPHYDARLSKKRGYLFELLSLFEQAHNIKFVYVSLPNKRLKKRFFEQRDIDLIYPFNPNWLPQDSGESELVYSAPIIQIMGGTMVLPNQQNLSLSSFSTLAVPRGFTPIEWYKLQGQYEFRIIEVANAWDALNMVLKGRADGADIELNVARSLLNKYGKRNDLVMATQLPLSQVHFYLATFTQPFLLQKLDKYMAMNPELIRALKAKYQLIESVEQLNN